MDEEFFDFDPGDLRKDSDSDEDDNIDNIVPDNPILPNDDYAINNPEIENKNNDDINFYDDAYFNNIDDYIANNHEMPLDNNIIQNEEKLPEINDKKDEEMLPEINNVQENKNEEEYSDNEEDPEQQNSQKDFIDFLFNQLKKYLNAYVYLPTYNNFINYLKKQKFDLTEDHLKIIDKWFHRTFEAPNLRLKKPDETPHKYLPIFSKFIGTFQIDTTFFNKIEKDEPNFYLKENIAVMCCVDIMSRYAYACILPKKTGEEVVKGLEELKKLKPLNEIESDQGTEYNNNIVINWCKENNIKLTFSDTEDKNKMGKVERFNRTLKTKILPYLQMAHKINIHDNKPFGIDKNQFQDILNSVMLIYNNTKHRSTKVSPNEYYNSYHEEHHRIEYEKQKARQEEVRSKIKYPKIGDYVIILKKPSKLLLHDKLNKNKYEDTVYRILRVNKNGMVNLFDEKNEKWLVNTNTGTIKNVKYYNIKVVQNPNNELHDDDFQIYNAYENEENNEEKKIQPDDDYVQNEINDEDYYNEHKEPMPNENKNEKMDMDNLPENIDNSLFKNDDEESLNDLLYNNIDDLDFSTNLHENEQQQEEDYDQPILNQEKNNQTFEKQYPESENEHPIYPNNNIKIRDKTKIKKERKKHEKRKFKKYSRKTRNNEYDSD